MKKTQQKNKRVSRASLKQKLKYWQRKLKMSNWDIDINYCYNKDWLNDDVLGQLDYCWTSEKVARISICPTYNKTDGNNIAWNIDTLILHELIHALVYDRSISLPISSMNSPRVIEFEEFICDAMAKIIFDCTKRK